MVFATIVPYGIGLIYFFAYARNFGKDGFLTKIYVLAVSGLIIVTLVSAYNFVCKPEAPYFLNGGATLWDAQTALAAAGIKLYDGVSGSCDAAVENLLKGDLAFNPNVKCNHHDHNHENGNHTCGSHSCGSHTCGTHNCN